MTDDDENPEDFKGVYTEKNFVNINQTVEKSVIDLFSKPLPEGNCSDLYFNEPLEDFNLLFVKNSWLVKNNDILTLPSPINL